MSHLKTKVKPLFREESLSSHYKKMFELTIINFEKNLTEERELMIGSYKIILHSFFLK